MDLPESIFGAEPERRGDAPGGHRAARGRPRRHPEHQDPGRGQGRWREAVAPEGHRPRPPGLDPGAALARWWRGPRPEAPQLQAEDPEEDGAPRARSARCRTGRRSPSSSSSTSGAGTPRRPRTRSPRSRASACTPPASATRGCCSCSTAPTRSRGSRSATSATGCAIILPEELNTYDVLVSDWLIFTKATLDTTVARLAVAPTGGDTTTAGRARTGADADDADDRRRDAMTKGRTNDQPRPPRHHHPADRVGEVVRELRRRTSTRSRSRRARTRSRSSTRSKRSSASRSRT